MRPPGASWGLGRSYAPGAQPEHLGSLRWPFQLASGHPKAEDLPPPPGAGLRVGVYHAGSAERNSKPKRRDESNDSGDEGASRSQKRRRVAAKRHVKDRSKLKIALGDEGGLAAFDRP